MRPSLTASTLAALLLAGCMQPWRPSTPPPPDPDTVRGRIARLLPARTANREGWAADLFTAFESLGVAPNDEHVCAALAIVGQESNFQADPVVPNLPTVARAEIEARAGRYGVPAFAVRAALALESPDGRRYDERLAKARTEKDLSDLYEDFIGSVPLGRRLFETLNPVRTGGPMQVSVAYAEQQVTRRHYPYPVARTVRDEVFTRRGGLYFGVAHLFDYVAPYDLMLFRFADYNAGHYASRNAAFQRAVRALAQAPLALDGDLLRPGEEDRPGDTERALRALSGRLGLDATQIRRDLQREKEPEFAGTKLYTRVFELADAAASRAVPRAVVPEIRLQGPKITRRLTTDWFARRVDERFRQCLAAAAAPAG